MVGVPTNPALLVTISPIDSPALADVVALYCGNPWRPGIEARQDAVRRSGFAPAPDRGPDAWLHWWDLLPDHLRGREAAIAACVGLSQSTDDPWESMTELARRLPRPLRKDAPALAGRALALARGLSAFVGTSTSLRETLAHIWTACFGSSLIVSDGLVDALRETPVWICGETGTGCRLAAEAAASSCQGRLKRSLAEWRPGTIARVDSTVLDEDGQVDALLSHIEEDTDGLPDALLVCDLVSLAPRGMAALVRRLEGPESRDPNAPRLIVTAATAPPIAMAQGMPSALVRPLSSITIEMPPLRARRQDVVPIAMAELATLGLGDDDAISERVTRFLDGPASRHPWPGNLRELRAVVRELALGLTPRLDPRAELKAPSSRRAPAALLAGAWTVSDARTWYARHVRAMCASDVEAARRLEINRGTLARILRDETD
jgi:hypothetical protein